MKRTVSAFLMTLAAILAFSIPTYADETQKRSPRKMGPTDRMDSFVGDEVPKGQLKIKEKGGGAFELIANEADLGDVLKAVGNKVGIRILLGDEIKAKRVTKWKEMPSGRPEEAIRDLLEKDIFYSMSYDQNSKVKEIAVGNARGGPVEHIKLEFAYGPGKGELGKARGQVAPRSFAASKNGDIYILDTANKRVQVYTEVGVHKHTIPIGQGFGEDIVLDNKGHIYIHFLSGMFTQYDMDGNIKSSIYLQSSRWGNVGGLPIIKRNNLFYIKAVHEPGYKLCALLVKGKLQNPSAKDLKNSDRKFLGKKEKEYEMKYTGRYIQSLTEISGGTKRDIPLKFPASASRNSNFIGDNDRGNIYFIERKGKHDWSLHVFDKNGNILKSSKKLYYEMRGTTTKSKYISNDGKFYSMHPGSRSVVISIYK